MGLAERERSEQSMGRNAYLVAAAIISLIFAVTHTWWGLTRALPGIDALFIQAHANSEVSWHQVGGTFLIGGVALLGDALRGQRSVTVPALIGVVYGMNLVVFVLLVATRYPAMFGRTVPQLLLFATMLALIAAGINRRRRLSFVAPDTDRS